jgi:hypothetical protein
MRRVDSVWSFLLPPPSGLVVSLKRESLLAPMETDFTALRKAMPLPVLISSFGTLSIGPRLPISPVTSARPMSAAYAGRRVIPTCRLCTAMCNAIAFAVPPARARSAGLMYDEAILPEAPVRDPNGPSGLFAAGPGEQETHADTPVFLVDRVDSASDRDRESGALIPARYALSSAESQVLHHSVPAKLTHPRSLTDVAGLGVDSTSIDVTRRCDGRGPQTHPGSRRPVKPARSSMRRRACRPARLLPYRTESRSRSDWSIPGHRDLVRRDSSHLRTLQQELLRA